MSREDQVNPISYAIISTSSKFSFQESIPLESLHPIRLNSLNRLLPYLGTQELTIKGRGVLSQPRGMTPLHGCCGNLSWNQVRANWPTLMLYSPLAIAPPPGLSWPQSSFMASGHILPSLAFLANFHIPNPQASIFVLGLGVSLCLLGGSGPPSNHHYPWATPFH
ncbi:hypothetical protein O181_059696 [Austropuccinia psidii MF-1]|uniref:Uncharacterized protein n=1 Tax=Austropuccinia psidii MF-1 TaxID=1389203 RepID=A0A9Q3EJG6_9BASI|nr:hypothetical protein [Austropuccinia psidii MF-1]